jgi:hypothetical protein
MRTEERAMSYEFNTGTILIRESASLPADLASSM